MRFYQKDSKRFRAGLKIPRCVLRGEGNSTQLELQRLTGQPSRRQQTGQPPCCGSHQSRAGAERGGQGNLSDFASCILHGVCRDPANSSQGAVYQSHSLAPRTEKPWKSLPKLTWESNRRNGIQPCKTHPSHFATSVSSQTSAVEEMTVSRRQRPQE